MARPLLFMALLVTVGCGDKSPPSQIQAGGAQISPNTAVVTAPIGEPSPQPNPISLERRPTASPESFTSLPPLQPDALETPVAVNGAASLEPAPRTALASVVAEGVDPGTQTPTAEVSPSAPAPLAPAAVTPPKPLKLAFVNSPQDAAPSPLAQLRLWLYKPDGVTIASLHRTNDLGEIELEAPQLPVLVGYEVPASQPDGSPSVGFVEIHEYTDQFTIELPVQPGKTSDCTIVENDVNVYVPREKLLSNIFNLAIGSRGGVQGNRVLGFSEWGYRELLENGMYRVQLKVNFCLVDPSKAVDFLVYVKPYIGDDLASWNVFPSKDVKGLVVKTGEDYELTLDEQLPVVEHPFSNMQLSLRSDVYAQVSLERDNDESASYPSILTRGATGYATGAVDPSVEGSFWQFFSHVGTSQWNVSASFVKFMSTSLVGEQKEPAFRGLNTIAFLAPELGHNSLVWRYANANATPSNVHLDGTMGQLSFSADLSAKYTQFKRPMLPPDLASLAVGDLIPKGMSIGQDLSPTPQAADGKRPLLFTSTDYELTKPDFPEVLLPDSPIYASAEPLSLPSDIERYDSLPPLYEKEARALGADPSHLVIQVISSEGELLPDTWVWAYDQQRKILLQVKTNAQGVADLGYQPNAIGIGYGSLKVVELIDLGAAQGFFRVALRAPIQLCQKPISVTLAIAPSLPPQDMQNLGGTILGAGIPSPRFDISSGRYKTTLTFCPSPAKRRLDLTLSTNWQAKQNLGAHLDLSQQKDGDEIEVNLMPVPRIELPYISDNDRRYSVSAEPWNYWYIFGSALIEPPRPNTWAHIGIFWLARDPNAGFDARSLWCGRSTRIPLTQADIDAWQPPATWDWVATKLKADAQLATAYWRTLGTNPPWSRVDMALSYTRDSFDLQDSGDTRVMLRASITRVRVSPDGHYMLVAPPIIPEIAKELQRARNSYAGISFHRLGTWPLAYQAQIQDALSVFGADAYANWAEQYPNMDTCSQQ
jgi:hypothetical protein